MPAVSVIGELTSAEDFRECSLFCKYKLVHDEIGKEHWDVTEGEAEGQTQLDVSDKHEIAVWAHPIDVSYTCASIRGWPKLVLEVWHQDEYSRAEIGESVSMQERY